MRRQSRTMYSVGHYLRKVISAKPGIDCQGERGCRWRHRYFRGASHQASSGNTSHWGKLGRATSTAKSRQTRTAEHRQHRPSDQCSAVWDKPRGPRSRPPPPLPLKWPASTLVTHLLHWQSRSEEPIASVDRADYGILQHLCLVNEPPRRLLVPRCIPTSPPPGAC